MLYRIHTLLTDNGVQFAHTGPEEDSGEDTSASCRVRQQARTGRCHAFGLPARSTASSTG